MKYTEIGLSRLGLFLELLWSRLGKEKNRILLESCAKKASYVSTISLAPEPGTPPALGIFRFSRECLSLMKRLGVARVALEGF